MVGAEFETIIDSGLVSPTGIDIYNEFLLVSDYATGEIIIYDISTQESIQESFRLQTNMNNNLMSIKVGPDGTIWFVCTNSNQLYQILPPLNGDLNADNEITLNDFFLLISHLTSSNLLDEEYLILADIDSNNSVDIFDLILLIDDIYQY